MEIHDLETLTVKYYLSEFTNTTYNEYLMTEAKRDYSFYELRVLLTMMFKYATDAQTKQVLKNLIRTATRLEMLNLPMPVLPKIGTAELRKFVPIVKSKGRTKKSKKN